MSKPTSGLIYIVKCPNCNFNKAIEIFYKDYIIFKCKKCKFKWKK